MLVNTPPMGWNTWNTFGLEPSDQLVRENVDAFVKLGLQDYGYKYIVVDDFWSKYYRNPETDLIEPDPVKFPHGMKALADYVHSKGLKFGMYSCTGTRTCGDFPGSFDHEYQDAQQLADWGVDFLKYDFCYKPAGTDGMLLYRRMGMALRATGRDILFNACNWGSDDVWSWIRSTGAHMYRSTGDIHDCSESYRKIVSSQLSKLGTSAPQCFNDLDMLTVGMYGKGLVGTDCVSDSTDADYRSQFSLWCMCSAPLFLGCDIRNMNEETYKLVTNRRLIAIDQDPECRPPLVIPHNWNDKVKTWSRTWRTAPTPWASTTLRTPATCRLPWSLRTWACPSLRLRPGDGVHLGRRRNAHLPRIHERHHSRPRCEAVHCKAGEAVNCENCRRELEYDEVGLSRKLISRGTRTFYCITCLAADFKVSEEKLRELIERYKAGGCTLFK